MITSYFIVENIFLLPANRLHANSLPLLVLFFFFYYVPFFPFLHQHIFIYLSLDFPTWMRDRGDFQVLQVQGMCLGRKDLLLYRRGECTKEKALW